MTRRVIFEGGIARIVDETLVSEAPIEAMMPFLERTMPTYVPIMPDHTRVVAYNPDTRRGGLLIELAPVRRTMRCQYTAGHDAVDLRRRDTEGMARFNIQLPYQYFYYGFTMAARHTGDGQQDFTLDTGLYLWRPSKLTDMTQPLWRGMIWNVDQGAWICWGGTHHTTASLAERIDDMVINFPNTTFNLHLDSPHPIDYANYTDWEAASADPLCYVNWRHWASRPHFPTAQDLFLNQLREAPPDPLPLTAGAVHLPAPPERFTVGRALEWMDNLPAPDQNRFLHALRRWTIDHPEEETPDDGPAPAGPGPDRATPGPAGDPEPTATPDRRRRRVAATAAG